MSHTHAPSVAPGLMADAAVRRDRHPPWYPPAQLDGTGLHVMNSLTETVEPFAPREGRLVRWYTCGPTVYDVAHMGHARAYLTFDIIRRIMEDYFGYAVIYQMNITDIDDKIIQRARVNTLLKSFKEDTLRGRDVAALRTFTEEALQAAQEALERRQRTLSEPIPDSAGSRAKAEREEKLMELQLKLSQLADTRERIAAAVDKGSFDELFAAAQSVNGDLLDAREGHKVTDANIFEQHARRYERSFFEDMQRLGVREPDVVTRVTEYVPQVVDFVQCIMDNGFAYRAESSVFFDTEAFIKAGHHYPKLKPTSHASHSAESNHNGPLSNEDDGAGAAAAAAAAAATAESDANDRQTTADEMAEGEGALSRARDGEKRSANDFALWKFSKPGEPQWPSPWGWGRPGWHIECSVMASDILGENMDIHSGGWDLKFPHHDNECAQSEACQLHHQWVNYFLHCGHLHIKGLKMSKSLKNFITIQQALDELHVTPRAMRLLFLANSWHRPMNFSDQSLDEAKERELVLRAFFGSVHAALRGDGWLRPQGANPHDRALLEQWQQTEAAVHAALCNNMDTPTALQHIMSLVAAVNQYLLSGERASQTLLRKVGRYVTRMLRVFGVVEGGDEVGLTSGEGAYAAGEGEAADRGGAGAAGGTSGEAAAQRPAAAMNPLRRLEHVVDALVSFRDAVRDTAREQRCGEAFLPLCDSLRDEALIDAGVRLEDCPGGATTWKSDDPVLLRREWRERREQQANERRRKLTNIVDKQRKLMEKWTKASYPPAEYFARQERERAEAERRYGHFDPSSGLPTQTVSGEEVGEKDVKRLGKELAKYVKLHEEFLAKGGMHWLEQQEADLAAMEEELKTL